MRLRSFFRAILAVLCFSPLVVMAAKPTFLVTLASAKAPATISPGQTVQVSYRVTNNTAFTLNGNGLTQIPPGLKQIGGANSCGSPFNLVVGGSCILYLEIIADEMRGAIHGGPVVCNTLAHPIYCSRPSEGSELNTTKGNGPTPPVNQVTLNVTPTTLDFAVNGTGSVTITNQSTTIAAENITARPPAGSAISVTQNTCLPSLAAGQQCTITFTATGAEANAQVQIAGINTDTKTVSVSTNIAFISVNSSAILDADGNSHVVFTVTNNINSAGAATNIQTTLPTSPAWSGVTATPDSNCSSIAPGGTCTISMTSSAPNLVGRLTIIGDNTNALLPTVAFRYQGGLVFAQEANTPTPGVTTSDIVAEVDASTNSGLAWGGAGTAVGVYNGSTTPCAGSTDGACNTTAIVTALGITPGSSSALLCTSYEIDSAGNSPCVIGNTCYNDWYLPAICQINNTNPSINCTGGTSIYTNLFSFGYLPDLATGGNTSSPGLYWGSTEVIGASATYAWAINFSVNGQLNLQDKTSAVGVRCTRSATS